jgi:hypothetical protein
MLQWPPWTAMVVGLLIGAAVGAAGGWAAWGRDRTVLATRVTALEAAEGAVQAERDRLHRELSDIVRERREMANTAEQLRTQVEQQVRRLETLANELAPPLGPSAGSGQGAPAQGAGSGAEDAPAQGAGSGAEDAPAQGAGSGAADAPAP